MMCCLSDREYYDFNIDDEISVKEGQIEDVKSIMEKPEVIGKEYERWYQEWFSLVGDLHCLKQMKEKERK